MTGIGEEYQSDIALHKQCCQELHMCFVNKNTFVSVLLGVGKLMRKRKLKRRLSNSMRCYQHFIKLLFSLLHTHTATKQPKHYKWAVHQISERKKFKELKGVQRITHMTHNSIVI